MGVRETLSIDRARRCLVLLYLFIRLTLLSWFNETLIQGTLIFADGSCSMSSRSPSRY